MKNDHISNKFQYSKLNTMAAPLPTSSNIDDEQIVTPWATKCGAKGFQYDRLVKKFGVQRIDEELIVRFETVTGHPAHPWLRRGIFFAHRELDEILTDFEANRPIFLYTGRGPSSEALHLGHMIPFIFTKWLQDVFKAILVIQMADDEKYYFKDLDFKTVYELGPKNAKDIIACGFDPNRTFIFSNRDYSTTKCVHDLVHEMFKKVNVNSIFKTFGLDVSSSLGQVLWPIYQTAAAYSRFFQPIFGDQKVRCLVAYAIDQDPYFRVGRDVAHKLNSHKPCSIMTRFLPALEGKEKMSSTSGESKTIFMNDDPKQIAKTIKKYAFSGGRDTVEEHRKHGGDLETDISFQYLRYFMYDDVRLAEIAEAYSTGQMLSGEIKNILSDIVTKFVTDHQVKREAVTQEMVDRFYDLEKFNVPEE
jgi:tryptophanyl-tRNA synthetase